MTLAACGMLNVGSHSVAIGKDNKFPAREAIAVEIENLRLADPDRRVANLRKLLSSILRPKTENEGRLLSCVAWCLGRVYAESGDDRILASVLSAGFDTDAAESMLGGLADFLSQQPDFLKEHAVATDFVSREFGGHAPTLARIGKHCSAIARAASLPGSTAAGEERSHRKRRVYAATNPVSRVFVDEKDTGLNTPIGYWDHVFLAPGAHRIRFVGRDAAVEVKVKSTDAEDVCFFENIR